jgi:hypothetical protein
MVFGALTLFTLACFTIMVWVVGMNSGDHMQNQTAADSAAYSGALVEAECLESIAFLNDGMAFVYYTELRYVVDAIVYSTLEVFEKHDQWIQQNRAGLLTDTAVGDGGAIPNEFGSAQANNPGAVANASYSPGLEPGPGQPAPDCGFVMMGDGGGQGQRQAFFDARLRNAQRRADQFVAKGKGQLWLADIHWAERIILAATPELVRRTCVQVALDNGAEWVAVSSDLDNVFCLPSDPAAQQNKKTPGFTDSATDSAGDDSVQFELLERYRTHKGNPIDGQQARAFPQWFNYKKGRSNAPGYQQVRICWNKRDWDHCEPTSAGQAPFPHAYDAEHNHPQPAGHWHVKHDHMTDGLDQMGNIIGPFDAYGQPPPGHDYGHGTDGGPDAPQHDVMANQNELPPPPMGLTWIQLTPGLGGNPMHHAVQDCPTCGGDGSVTHTQIEAQNFNPNLQPMAELTFTGQGQVQPAPIIMNKLALRAGVTVATWRHSRGLDKQLFPANDFGDLAIASAQIGIRDIRSGRILVVQQVDDQTATFAGVNGNVTLDITPNSTSNLDLGLPGNAKDPGMRFGARLVPIARENTWEGSKAAAGGAASAGLNDLLNGSRWWSSAANPTGSAASGDLQTALTNLAGKPGDPMHPGFVDVSKQVKDLTQ